MAEKSKTEILLASHEMEPIAGTVEVDIPIQTLWECFRRADLWPRWNACFRSARNRDLVRGEKLVWVFNAIRWWYPYLMPASANIVEAEPLKKVTWEVTVLPGFFARHTYHMEDLGNGRSRFGSWEQAMGWSFRLFRRFWLAHFTFVKDRSLEGAKRLEGIYRDTGKLDLSNLPRLKEGPRFGRGLLLLVLLLLLAGGGFGLWFYLKFVRLHTAQLAPGVTAVFGGGSNALVVNSGNEVLVVDPKFSPGSKNLRRWIDGHTHGPVTRVVDTHYHYDHTQGNVLYPKARFFARAGVADFMREDDKDYWPPGRPGLPTDPVSAPLRLTVGSEEVVLVPVEPAHTHGDLVVLLPRHNLVATGDVVFHTYYPFLDTDPRRGASIPGMVRVIRGLVRQYPGAVFMPGHGPLASARQLARYADYLESLWGAAEQARRDGGGPDEMARKVDFAAFHLSILPSFHNTKLPIWATACRNVRDAYLLAGQADAAAERSHS
jgi:glyoxylase-like metal-dependent hydrolase (beta-lactamase superfamily II)